MQITKCDMCGKQVKKGAPELHFSYPRWFPMKSLCEKCAAPIMPFLKKTGLIKDES